MPLILYEGPEGAGKSAMMTDELLYHHKCGGKVFAFPGYELLGARGKVLSELLMPEDCIKILNEDVTGYAIGIDEINNFFNHHRWQGIMNDILTSMMTQRRKRSFALLATVTAGRLVSLDIRSMFHEVVHCLDAHAVRKSIPRGQKTYFEREDTRGLLSGRIGTKTKGMFFDHKRTHNHFNSFSPIDPKYLIHSVKLQKKNVFVDSEGNAIDEVLPTLTQNIPTHWKTQKYAPILGGIAEIIKDKGEMAMGAVYSMARSQGVKLNENWISRILKKEFGVISNWGTRTYVPVEE